MTADPDDALHWDGDEADAPIAPPRTEATTAASADAAQPSPAAPVPEQPATDGADAAGRGEGSESSEHRDEPVGIGNVALVFYGIIGGAYLLFAIGWIVGGLRLRPRALLLLADWMYFPWMGLAALAPLLWFAVAWVLTRGKATWIRVLALIAGVVLLVPWPFVMFGTVGA
ncbi:MAG: hypothetical protein JSS74_00105 [Actinobacteria bacterium]|nr:hypothetical protein [Actinomycetota bacterium]